MRGLRDDSGEEGHSPGFSCVAQGLLHSVEETVGIGVLGRLWNPFVAEMENCRVSTESCSKLRTLSSAQDANMEAAEQITAEQHSLFCLNTLAGENVFELFRRTL
jgi:hypothetical protein